MDCSVYGLGLRVNVALAGLKGLRPPRAIQVSMSLGSMPANLGGMAGAGSRQIYMSDEAGADGQPALRAWKLNDGAYYRLDYVDGTEVVIDGKGRRIWATAPRSATVEDTATYLLGPALGFLLRLRGITCLHASAVAIDGKAVAFVGPAGAGKSSTAAAFARAGHPVLTDDVAALVEEDGAFVIQPAYPRLRLWPDIAAALFGSFEALPRITPGWDKRYLDLRHAPYRFQEDPLPLAAIYLLCGRTPTAPRCEPVAPKTALMSLVSDTYTTYLLDRTLRAREFGLLGRLVEKVPVRRLITPCEAARLGEVRDVVAADLRALAGRKDERPG